MLASVIIPTFQRHAHVRASVGALARQELPAGSFEVLLGVDGHDPEAENAARLAWHAAGRDAGSLVVRQGEKAGLAAARNRVLPLIRGRVVISLNDDVVVEPGFIASHVRHQADAERDGRPALVEGATPWRVHEPDTLFARLVRETSMIFFHDVMRREKDPGRDWGFRHAWPLNLSIPAPLVRELGGWTVFPATYGYEDDEFAFRAIERFGARVLYRPDARAVHDHAMTPREYLAREYKLGYAALGFARAAPGCARAMFGRDVTTDAEVAFARAFVARQLADVRRAAATFFALGEAPAAAPDGPHSDLWVRLAYEHHLPIKRWVWRRGFLDAHAGEALAPEAALAVLTEHAAA